MTARDEDGFTLQDTLEGLISRSKNPERRAEYEAQLILPPFPTALGYLWQTFFRLRRRKGSNGFSANPIEWPDIDAFLRQLGSTLAPWEIEIVEDLDDLYLTEQSKQQNERMNKTKTKTKTKTENR